jgi:hypothetical protein
MPQELSFDDARMALNGLSSFRYLTTAEFEAEGNATAIHCEGVCVQGNQAWRASCRVGIEEQALLELYSLGDQTWWGVEGGQGWLRVAGSIVEDRVAVEAAPFWLWSDAPYWEIGTLLPEPMQSIAGVRCYEYLFASEDAQLHLCVIPGGMVPLRMEFSAAGESHRVLITREFTHFDDPSNVVEPPADWVQE